jgi:hypothetical protein
MQSTMANTARIGLSVVTFTYTSANFVVPHACPMDTTYIASANANTTTTATSRKESGWTTNLAYYDQVRRWPLAGFCFQSLRC